MWDLDREICFAFDHSQAGDRIRSFALHDEAEDETLVVCCADFSLDHESHATSYVGAVGQGRVYEAVLDSLVEATTTARECFKNTAVLWATHFAPGLPQEFSDSLKLLDDTSLLNAAIKSSVAAILAGHVHHTFEFDAVRADSESVKVLCSGPAAGISEHRKYAFCELEISVSNGVVELIKMNPYAWDPHTQDFESMHTSKAWLPTINIETVEF